MKPGVIAEQNECEVYFSSMHHMEGASSQNYLVVGTMFSICILQKHTTLQSVIYVTTVSTDLMCCLQNPSCRWSGIWPKFYITSNLTGSDQQYWSDTIMSFCKPVDEALGDLIWVELSDRTE
jgi:hypothetical protein